MQLTYCSESKRGNSLLFRPAVLALFALAMSFVCTGKSHAQAAAAPVCECDVPKGPPNPHPYLVGYLPLYKGWDWVAYTPKIDFKQMTHLNLAFLNPPMCTGACTAKSDMTISEKNLTDAGIDAIVTAAHAHGVKVLASIGGAAKDKNIMQFYNSGLSEPLADALTSYVMKHKLDGIDVDIEQPTMMGVPFTTFVNALGSRLRPQGKLMTTAVARYIQAAMQDEALKQFDIVNVMIYGSYDKAVAAMIYYNKDKKVPAEKLTLGIGFFGNGRVAGKHKEENYNLLLANYPNAWAVDTVGGGSFDDGAVFNYEGEATVAQETKLGRQYGGVMIWELSGDDPGPHSILAVIQKNLNN
jgi:chitinase